MKTMTGSDIREEFLKFFENKDHKIVSSGPLVPKDDPTLLFTNAGMVQFKDLFLGHKEAPYRRAATAQKCVRAGGKHNDLENVGKTARHQTFFEMLGNFSFGDYFKKEAIKYAWELLVDVFELPQENLWITIYKDDDEAAKLWQTEVGVVPERILRLGEEDNFWSMGDVGPCGPCSEIIYDRGKEYRCDADVCAIGVCDCDRWLELWNLVFMQYERDEDGSINPLQRTGVDTGLGLERIASVLQDVDSNYETDLFMPLIDELQKMCDKSYERSSSQKDMAFRVIVDHVRTSVFLISEGVLPLNEGRGYVLRRILRRACRFGRELGFEEPFLYRLVDAVVQLMSSGYPELKESADFVKQMIRKEEERFGSTLEQGLDVLGEIIEKCKEEGTDCIAAEDAFQLYDTFGFPLDLCEDVAIQHGLEIDYEGFEKLMQEQREKARRAQQQDDSGIDFEKKVRVLGDGPENEFCGYDSERISAEVTAVLAEDESSEEIQAEQTGWVVLDRTPFYAESGGQVGDTGHLRGPKGVARILDTQLLGRDHVTHEAQMIEGIIEPGDEVVAEVDRTRRANIRRNHTATHLLHTVLRQVLGDHVHQSGSLVSPKRLRFDFTHHSALSKDEKQNIETRINERILEALPIRSKVTSLQSAIQQGALAFFGDRYDEDNVRVIEVGNVSMELCGGTHVSNTAEIGLFKIIDHGSVGSGLRRIEAVTGKGVLRWMQMQEEMTTQLAKAMDAPAEKLVDRAHEMREKLQNLQRRSERLSAKLGEIQARKLADEAQEVNGIQILAQKVEADGADKLRQMADSLRNKLGDSALILATVSDDSVTVIGAATDGAVEMGINMGDVVGRIGRELDGGGGGRPNMAQAGGNRPDKLEEALSIGRDLLMEDLEGSCG